MYVKLVSDFYNELIKSKNPSEDLRKEKIVAGFMNFAKQRKYDEEILNEYAEIKDTCLEGETLDDYIFRYILGLYSEVALTYCNIKSNYEENLECLKKYKIISVEKRKEIKQRLSNNELDNDLEYSKYGYYINYYVSRINAVTKELNESNLINQALVIARTPYWSGFNSVGVYSLYNLRDYNMMNGQDYIWFGKMPIRDMHKMRYLRNNNHAEYLKRFADMIEQYAIKEKLIKFCKENYYLSKRLNIVKSAIGLFERKEYVAFCYLMAPQTEGMFSDYLKICDIEFDNKAGMTTKVEKFKNNAPDGGDIFLEYAYFRYDFPALRNPMAHGVVLEVNNETAYELLMDSYWVMAAIDSDRHKYKKWVNLLRKISTIGDACEVIFDYFRSSNIEYQAYKDIFISWINSEFDDVIKFYDLSMNVNVLHEYLNSESFYNSIWCDMPLQCEDNCTKDFGVMKWNDEPLLYEDFVELLSEKQFSIPREWHNKYLCFIKNLNVEKEKFRIKVNKFIDELNESNKMME